MGTPFLKTLPGSVLARVCAGLCVTLLAYLSLIPPVMEVRTGWPGQIEHALAYAGAGLWLALAFPRARFLYIVGGLVAYAGLHEIGQLWVPGRKSQTVDWLASCSGAIVGTAVTLKGGSARHSRGRGRSARPSVVRDNKRHIRRGFPGGNDSVWRPTCQWLTSR
jgi:hypothetical protein